MNETLQTIVGEFKNVCPQIAGAFIFRSDGETLAADQNTAKQAIETIIESFRSLADQAQSVGGIEALTIQGTNSQLQVNAMGELYLATVSLRTADQKAVRALTQVIVPSVVQLISNNPAARRDQQQTALNIQPPKNLLSEAVYQIEENEPNQPDLALQPKCSSAINPAKVLPKAPVNQFMVEKIGGLLVASDTVRIDADVVAKWSDLYDGKAMTRVKIETLDGKVTVCKFRGVKEAKGSARGIIQVPEKILQLLHLGKGQLVLVGPVVE